MENITIGNRAAEKEHGPRFWNKCAMEELWRLWPEEFAATVKRTLNNKKDFQTITHLGMFMEDLGLGTNIVKEGSIAMRYIHHLILNIQNCRWNL